MGQLGSGFFSPAKPILNPAPWIFVRGNHENCERNGWQGWFLLLDPHPLTQTPSPLQRGVPHTKPFQVPLDRQNVVVMDTTDILDDEFTDQPDPTLIRQYAVDFDVISKMIDPRESYWLVGHRPIWAVATIQESSVVTAAPLEATLRSALQKSSLAKLPASVNMILSGHIHLFESLNFADDRPRQFVFGAGGTERDPALTDTMLNRRHDILALLNIESKNIDIYNDFSFGLIQRDENRWQVAVKNTAGEDVFLFDILPAYPRKTD